jgi:hypothetical protein
MGLAAVRQRGGGSAPQVQLTPQARGKIERSADASQSSPLCVFPEKFLQLNPVACAIVSQCASSGIGQTLYILLADNGAQLCGYGILLPIVIHLPAKN